MNLVANTLVAMLVFSSFLVAQKRIITAEQAFPLDQVEDLILPKQDNENLKKKELSLRKSGRADHFAVPIPVDIDIHQHGTWEYLDDGLAIWRKQIISKDAKSLNLGFSQYDLPMGAAMFLYSADRKFSYGPFTKSDNEDHAQFWSPILKSDHIVIELQSAVEKIDQISLTLSYVNHDFMDFSKSGLGSGSCNLDVACGSEDGWPLNDKYGDAINSVGAYTLNGIAQCSGALINTTKNDCTPYFLTANHCEINQINASSVVVYWNFRNSECRQPDSAESGANGDGVFGQFNSGSVLRSSWAQTDMTLIELDDPVIGATTPFYAGWDRQESLGDSSVCVHHPGVQEKRISFDFDTLVFDVDDGVDFIRVENWEIGTTEGGSSGSPLFNKKGKIVGQLFGGQANCGNQLWDRYGWLSTSWEGGGTPGTRLKDWLDPLDLGVEEISGKACQFQVAVSSPGFIFCTSQLETHAFDITISENFESDVKLSIDDLPNGVTAEFSKNPAKPGETIQVSLNGLNILSKNKFILKIIAIDLNNNGSIANYLLDAYTTVPAAATLVFPSSTSANLSTRIVFEWENSGDSYDLEIAEDADFNQIFLTLTGLKETKRVIELNSDQSYFWRVKAYNICGEGTFSEAATFKIEKVNCKYLLSTDTPIEILPAAPNIVTSNINYENSGIVTGINIVNIIGRHSWNDDLSFSLIGPDGTEVRLMTEVCGDTDNFSIGFDDQSSLEIADIACPPTLNLSYKPEQALSIFIGKQAMGQWQLKIDDEFENDGGFLDSWELEICANAANDFSLIAMEEILVCNHQLVGFPIELGLGFGPEAILTGTDSLNILEYAFMSNPNGNNSEYLLTITNIDQISTLNYSFQINATQGSQISNLDVKLILKNSPIAPTLNTPLNLDTMVSIDTDFVWESSIGVQNYLFEISLLEDFSSVVESINTNELMLGLNQELEKETSYFWRVTAQNDCGQSSSDIFSFTTEKSNAIFDLADSQGVSIYPVPTSKLLTIDLGKLKIVEVLDIQIFSMQGKLIQNNYNLTTSNIVVDVSTMDNGVYLLKIRLGEKVYFDKIIVQK